MPADQTRNRLLAALPPRDFEVLRPSLKPIDLPLRFMLETAAKPIEHVYFLEAGIASVVAMRSRTTQGEVGLIGFEGMSGLPVILGNHQTPNATYMQAPGHGLRVRSETLRRILARCAGIQKVLLR